MFQSPFTEELSGKIFIEASQPQLLNLENFLMSLHVEFWISQKFRIQLSWFTNRNQNFAQPFFSGWTLEYMDRNFRLQMIAQKLWGKFINSEA